MRYVPANCLHEGMICGKRIRGKNGILLLNYGTVLQQDLIGKIREIGLNGIYIEDRFSRDILVDDIISDTLRSNSVKAVKDFFRSVTGKKSDTTDKLLVIHEMVDDILNSVLSSKGLNVNLMDLKIFDDYTYFHSVNVGVLSILVGNALKLNQKQLHTLGVAAMMHDIGKFFVPKEILNKPAALSQDEFSIMKGHSFKGFEYLNRQFNFNQSVLDAILDHHERQDGSGYPYGKQGQDISRFGCIIAIADVFDALTSDRPYRHALPAAEAIEFIMGGTGSAFDEVIVKAFLNKITPYAPGMTVSLSNGASAVVVANQPQNCLRPIVRVFRENNQEIEPYEINLLKDAERLDITITGQEAI